MLKKHSLVSENRFVTRHTSPLLSVSVEYAETPVFGIFRDPKNQVPARR
jgi:hypothetical protein